MAPKTKHEPNLIELALENWNLSNAVCEILQGNHAQQGWTVVRDDTNEEINIYGLRLGCMVNIALPRQYSDVPAGELKIIGMADNTLVLAHKDKPVRRMRLQLTCSLEEVPAEELNPDYIPENEKVCETGGIDGGIGSQPGVERHDGEEH